MPFGDVPLHPTCADGSICHGVSSCQLRTTARATRCCRTWAFCRITGHPEVGQRRQVDLKGDFPFQWTENGWMGPDHHVYPAHCSEPVPAGWRRPFLSGLRLRGSRVATTCSTVSSPPAESGQASLSDCIQQHLTVSSGADPALRSCTPPSISLAPPECALFTSHLTWRTATGICRTSRCSL